MQTYPITAFSHASAPVHIGDDDETPTEPNICAFSATVSCPAVRRKATDASPIPSSSSPSLHAETPCTGAPWRTPAAHVGTRIPPAIFPLPAAGACGRTGAFLPNPPSFSPALRARISGGEYQDVRARPVVGLSLARVPAIRPVRLHFRARPCRLQPGGAAPSTATVPTTTSGSSRPPDRRLDRSCQETIPSPAVPTTRPQIRGRDARGRAVSVHATCKQLLVG